MKEARKVSPYAAAVIFTYAETETRTVLSSSTSINEFNYVFIFPDSTLFCP